MKSEKSALAKKLVQLRHEMGMTQDQVAKSLGIKRSTYAYYERSTTPPLNILNRLAKIFNVLVDNLSGGEGIKYIIEHSETMATINCPPPQYVTNPSNPSELSVDERLILMRYRILSPETKEKVETFIDSCLSEADKY